MEKIYISGKITGDPDYLAKFERAEADLLRIGFASILNPAKVNKNLPEDFNHKEYMEVSIAELRCCQAVYMLRDWKDSKGATIEKAFAENLGKEIFYQV